jgi:UDP-N-acetylmuramyl pentapeptide phosphotransferase/UDP-N-acetylglucosamine-1-phosphate transferase
MPGMPALAPIAAFVVALLVAWLLQTPAGRRIALDLPNERSLHDRPVPRTGGIAIVAGVATGCAVQWPGLGVILAAAAALAVISLLDDVRHLPVAVRLSAHVAAAAVALMVEVSSVGVLALLVLALAVAWTANLYNFMDGSDGLAGGMTVVGFATYALAAGSGGNTALAVLCASVAAAALSFLAFNWHPARLFMGDVGSVPLGFLAGAIGLAGWSRGLWPLWFPLLVFAPFMGDATLTLIKRAWRRERVWEAHRDHYYQRLVRMGFGHRRTAGIEYGAMLGCAGLALLVFRETTIVQVFGILLVAVALCGAAVWVDLRWKAGG